MGRFALSPEDERKALAATGRLVPSVIVAAPPSTNNLFATIQINGVPRRVPSKDYRAWQKAAEGTVRTLTSPTSYPVTLKLDLLGKWNKQRDADNTIKAISDALVANGVLAGDDLTCVSGLTLKLVGGDGPPRVRVSFESTTPNLFGG